MIDIGTYSVQDTRSFFGALRVQMRVIGALLMRELHTRYGRENIGYLWLIGEPLMLGTVIGAIHAGGSAHESDMNPVTFAITGYCIYIMFRGIVNRSEGALESNLPLLYHRMVTVLDVTFARALLEAAGTFMSYSLIYTACMILGLATWPVRPLFLFLGIVYIFWWSLAISMIITGGTYERSLLERLVHPFSYFMIPLCGAFYRIGWIPQPYRGYLMWVPFPQMFEVVRYGVFQSADLEFVDFTYITGFCLVLTVWGLLAIRSVKKRIHLH